MTDIVISTRYYRYGWKCHLPTPLNIQLVVNQAFPLMLFSAKHLYACVCGIIDTYTNLTGIRNGTYIRITSDVTFSGYIQVL